MFFSKMAIFIIKKYLIEMVHDKRLLSNTFICTSTIPAIQSVISCECYCVLLIVLLIVIALYEHSCLCFMTCEAEPIMTDP